MVPTDTPASKFEDPNRVQRWEIGERTINRITHNSVPGALSLYKDSLVLFLTHDNTDLATIFHRVNEDLIPEHIKFLLVVSSSIRGAG